MSSGAVALCKHFERGGYSSDPSKGRNLHPYWKLPERSNENKSLIAEEILEEMLGDAVWRNVMLLHPGVAVYEVRNGRGYGMRWTLDVEGEEGEGVEKGQKYVMYGQGTTTDTDRKWNLRKVTFRGFLEPIEGLDHELDIA